MFAKTLEQIFTKDALKEAYQKINKASVGIDELSFLDFERDLDKNIEELQKDLKTQKFSPEPLKRIFIQKEDNEQRPLGLSSIKDKIVQRVLYDELNPYFDELFSNKSYAYRPNKSAKNAINRVSDFINQKKYKVVLKSDIDDFFEKIDHQILLNTLKAHIKDTKLINLINLFLDIGIFENFNYQDHFLGVHQGDILSPLLSNIYLDKMDKFLEKKDIDFVRFADDFVVLFYTKEDAKNLQKDLQEFLKSIKLSLNKEKTYIHHLDEGFGFLGVFFKKNQKSVINERFQESISKLHKISKKQTNFKQYTNELNSLLFGLKNYYLDFIKQNQTQLKIIKEHLLESIAQKISILKKQKKIKSKKDLKEEMKLIRFDILDFEANNKLFEYIIALSKNKLNSTQTYKNITKKVKSYTKKFAVDTTLHISGFGIYLGFSKNNFVIKKQARVIKTFPLSKIKRIILEGEGFSLSSKVLKIAALQKIPIDLIDQFYTPYASFLSYKASISQMIYKQAMILNTPKQLYLAKAFLTSKAKNQLNYLKYQNKYHKNLQDHIKKIQQILPNLKNAKTIDQLMGYEGSISVIYWDGVKSFVDAPFEKRITKGAKDLVNSSLNYGYAILYGTIQEALVKAGLSLNISFLHALDENKPTLVFDLIEEFRTYIVDRVIFAMINKNEPISLDKNGFLTQKSKNLIAKNIKEKLGDYVSFRKTQRVMKNIIEHQAFALARFVKEETKSYKPFIGKY